MFKYPDVVFSIGVGIAGILICYIIFYCYGTIKVILYRRDRKRRLKNEIISRKRQEIERIRKDKREQAEFLSSMIFLGENSLDLFEEMPKLLHFSERYLNEAESHFSKNAIVPFWDSIEKVINQLILIDNNLNEIKKNLSKYSEIAKKYKGTPPRFPISIQSVEKLSVSCSIASRMNAIVYSANCRFEFAAIYEQRKTNQVLEKGFDNLARALDMMTSRITDSINSLEHTVTRTSELISSRLDTILSTQTQNHFESVILEKDRSGREKKILKVLEKIERHERPII